MDTLDQLVTKNLVDRLLTPDRLAGLLSSLTERRATKAAEVDGRIVRLQGELTETEGRLKRVYTMVEDGIAELDDILRDRIASLKMDRERIQTSLDRVKTHAIPAAEIPPSVIAEFGKKMREQLLSSEIPSRKAHLQSIVDEVEVGDKMIKIVTRKNTWHLGDVRD